MHEQFIWYSGDDIHIPAAWNWLKYAGLNPESEAKICTAQEQALQTNDFKFNKDKEGNSSICRFCNEIGVAHCQ